MSEKPVKVLLIEDNPGDVRLIREMLSEASGAQFNLEWAERLSTGLNRLTKRKIDVVLLDLGLSDSRGLDTFASVHAQAPQVPIVVLTGLADEMLAVKALREGVQDYLVKGKVDSNLLVRAIRYAIERKQTEEALRESEERYRTLFQHCGTAINVIENDKTFSLVNKGFEELTGYTKKEVEGKMTFVDILSEKEKQRIIGYHEARRRGVGAPNFYENKIRRKDGEIRNILVTVGLVPGTKKSIGSLIDITEMKKLQRELSESEERYRTLFQYSGTAVALIEEDMTISVVNKEIEELLGYMREDIIGKTFVKFLPEKEKQRLISYHEARRRGEKAPTSYETKIRTKDGEIRAVLASVGLIPGTKKSIASIIDIAEREKTAQELKRKSREIRNYARQMKKAYQALERAYLEMIHALVISVETRDPYTRGHSERVTQYSKEIAKEMGLEEKELKNLELACRIHDVGKIGVSDKILLKDERLTIAEWAEMKMHPVRGAEMLTFSEFFKPVIPIVRYHHERWDGKGYPDGLKGEEIPLGARIMAVADTFDAMSSARPYRDAVDLKKILEEMKENAGGQLDPQIVEIWLKIMDKYGVPELESTYKQNPSSVANIKEYTIKAKKGLSAKKKKSFKSDT